MNADLETTLSEMGPGYRRFVDILIAADTRERVARPGRSVWRPAVALAAASIAVAALFHFFRASPIEPPAASKVYPGAYVMALGAENGDAALESIVRTQNPDGSWENDFLTRQNAAVLRGSPEMRIPYLKAMRYLRARGLKPLSDEEMKDRVSLYRKMMAKG